LVASDREVVRHFDLPTEECGNAILQPVWSQRVGAPSSGLPEIGTSCVRPRAPPFRRQQQNLAR
jgi:hypothetical protein